MIGPTESKGPASDAFLACQPNVTGRLKPSKFPSIMRQRNLRSRDELKQALEIQRASISSSAKSYDHGNKWEALRLSTSVYNLVHDHGSIKSLLGQLGIIEQLSYFASHDAYDQKNLLRETPLVMLRVYGDGRAEYLPDLDDGPPIPPRRLGFKEWWEDDVVLADGAQFMMTRKRLVFVLRNQEGGGHYSAEMNDQIYLRFSQAQATTPFVHVDGKQPAPILGVEFATMRQISWELTKTLDAFGPIA